MMPMAVPGTIDATMERALSQYPQYAPRALHRDPWILHFESFLNEEEVNHTWPRPSPDPNPTPSPDPNPNPKPKPKPKPNPNPNPNPAQLKPKPGPTQASPGP